MQAAQAFDGIDLGGHFTQHGGLVAAAGADFEHPAQFACGGLAQEFNHARNHPWLGDGLTQADGQAGVLVGLVYQRAIYKAMALDTAHGGQHTWIAQALCGELLHHALAHGQRVHAQALRQVGAGQRLGFGSSHAAVHARRERGPLLHAGIRLRVGQKWQRFATRRPGSGGRSGQF